jgi:hypothetical protein
MSTQNIVSIEPDSDDPLLPTIIVTFRTHRGDLLSYRYSGYAAAAIMAGQDPAEFFGSPA